MGLFDTLFDEEKRAIRKAQKKCELVLRKEEEYANKSDDELKAVTASLRLELQNGKTLEQILPDAYAASREAAKRVLGLFPYPVQILGGILLNEGDIAEMKTGEGKTLTAVMPIYLNALTGKGAHVVTVNEYLATRDAQWMGDIYRFLGLTVGCNTHSLTRSQKREAFACDITYTTNSELGFDYLRDNMVTNLDQRVLRGLNYAVLDEVDSILIDEARTPLIISGAGEMLDNQYIEADQFAKSLKNEDFEIDEQDRSVNLLDSGIHKADVFFKQENIYNGKHADLVHYIQNALRANYIMQKDVEYVVTNNEVVLIDSFTGRKMEGREFSNGMHQAIQAKEGVGIKQETQTLATITYQNFFRLYSKLSGMTGTAKSEENEFLDTYNMRVYEIPTNKPVIRDDQKDEVFGTKEEKYKAIVEEVKKLHEKGQPVLVGTISVSTNELISKMLQKEKIPHVVLNALNDEHEAEIVAHAGNVGAVTIATNMAGRGTDIKLPPESIALGGLVVLGSERHEAQRIDDQLRGRSGRQGDPGMSRFYVSMEDDLIKQFASEESEDMIERFKNGKGNVDHIRAMIDKTQLRAMGLHFDARKNTLEYDNVLMQQRKIIFEQRDQVLEMENIRPLLTSLVENNMKNAKDSGQLEEYLKQFEVEPTNSVKEAVVNLFAKYDHLHEDMDQSILHQIEKNIFLHILDREWIQHVDQMEHLKTSIRLRGYAQQKPTEAYRDEGYTRFMNMMQNIQEQTVFALMNMQTKPQE